MSQKEQSIRVMIAGVGGGSLGTELLKSLQLAGKYEVFGCDISPSAYGMFDRGFVKTFLLDPGNYIQTLLQACKATGVRFLIPGGEQPTALISESANIFSEHSITLLGNSASVVKTFSDKKETFRVLSQAGCKIPKTAVVRSAADIQTVGLPCIVKPSTGSGGSSSVFFATSVDEALMYAEFIRRMDRCPIAQEYIHVDEGEFTIGVLSLPDKTIVGSIVLRRALDAKLSVAYKGRGGIISSGYTQGFIGEFPDLRHQAEGIAAASGSCGPLNIQGRIRNGQFVPFEINPRFSASTFLRAMAGFNEVDMLIQYHLTGKFPTRAPIKPGWYLRSLAETFVEADRL
jgi:carbamoyl-phosphate synthase large subunit